MPRRKRSQLSRQEKLDKRRAAHDALVLDPANVLSDDVWREAPRTPCEWGPEGCDGGGYCDGHCHDRPI